jgi:hypothetical protein
MTEQYPEFLQAADQRRREDEGRAAVVDYLCSLGVDESVASVAWIAVQLAVGRHAEKIAEQHAEKTAKARGKGIKKIYDDKAAKDNLEEIERAAERLVEAIEKSSDYAWNQLATEATRIIRRSAFEADVRMVRDSAADALGRLKLNGKPVGAKAALVDELAMIWRRATGKMPDKSGGATLNKPYFQFGKFVARAVSTVAGDFEKGFSDLVRSAADRHDKRNPERVGKPRRTI